ncbi:MAG TPA: inorganic diphosphatase [Trueperaceae bacterium]
MSRELYERRHPHFPDKVWVVIEQPPHEPKRYRYVSERGEFFRTDDDSLAYLRGFSGAYGWIAGTGTPPGVHFDALVLTIAEPRPGEVVEAAVAGMFFMASGDHKFVTVDVEAGETFGPPEWERLTPQSRAELRALYPDVRDGEGWHGSGRAKFHLLEVEPTHD